MKNILAIALVATISYSCKDDSIKCADTDNAKIDGQCFWGFMSDYDVEGIWATDGQLVELQKETIELEFRGNGPTFIIVIDAGVQKLNGAGDAWIYENGLLEEGRTYTSQTDPGTYMLENGSAGGPVSITITKVDRETKKISGYFKWNLSRTNSQLQSVSDTVEGEFTDLTAGISSIN
ncbi:MAG: hypothetical protein AB7O48_09020 [Cyclobacteriaceae bacterium]